MDYRTARDSEERAKIRELDEKLLLTYGKLHRKTEQLLELETTCSLLRSAEAARAREASDARAAQAFSGFLSTELQSQVMVQRQMLDGYSKMTEALVDADVTTRDRSRAIVRERPAGVGEASGAIPANLSSVAGCTPGDTPKGRRCCGAHRKTGKNTGTARRVRNKT